MKPAENHRDAGRRGEDIALLHLLAKGYTLVQRNYRFGRGEIDLILDAPDGALVFVEVKANRVTEKGRPLDRLDRRKMLQLQRLAQRYVWQAGQDHRDMRFDAVGVDLPAEGPPRIEHHEAAFLPDGAGYR